MIVKTLGRFCLPACSLKSSSETVPVKFLLFPSITHQNPFVLKQFPSKFLLFPSITHQNLFVPIKFSNSSNQIPLVPINNPSKSFCSHQLPINFTLFPSNFLFFPTQPYINPHKALKFVRDWGRRLLGVAEQKVRNFCLPGFVKDRGQICFLQGRLPHFFLHVHLSAKSVTCVPITYDYIIISGTGRTKSGTSR